MSNPLAIAAVSRTLRNLLLTQVPALDGDLSDLEVTLQPPDVARKNVTKAQLNLFLYQVAYNAAWRNLDMPRQVRSGESAMPALALNLHFLLTAYGRGESDNDALSHRVLAAAMSVLYDHALLGADEIHNALTGTDLDMQVDRVRLTPQTLNIEELSKLWTAFQASYRVSTAYEASVVLIDSRSTARAPLPVLRRGADGRGVIATASSAPVLDTLKLPLGLPALRLGEDFELTGRQLGTADTVARLSSPRLESPVDIAPAAGDPAGTLRVHVAGSGEDSGALSRWAPGIYTVALRVQPAGRPPLLSNELVLALAPVITVSPLTAAAGDLTLSLTCAPRIRDGQRVFLVFGDRVLAPHALTNPVDTMQPTALVFQIAGVTTGTWTVRLRVDGVDSIPVDFSGATPAFAPSQQVKVT